MSRNLALRIAVAAVFIPAILWISYAGGWWLYGMLALFLALGMGEYLFHEGWRPSGIVFWATIVVALAVYSTVAAPIAGQHGKPDSFIFPVILEVLIKLSVSALFGFFLISGMLFALGKSSPAELFQRHSRLFWGLVYLTGGYLLVFLLGSGTTSLDGGDALLFLFGVLWLGDTAAMAVGKGLGKHKLAPAVSPNKTVEGFLGGIAGATLIGVIMYAWKLNSIGIGHILALAIGTSIFGQLGDLVESMWKRSVGIKDSSSIIPGHGGILDRFDSLLFAAPFVYAYLILLHP